MKYNGHDLHHYLNHTELHIDPPAFKIGQQVKLTTKGKEVWASRGQLFGLEDTFFVTTMTVSTLVFMGRKEADSDIQSSGWHYGINRMADDEGAGWDKSVEADHIEAVDQGGRFTLGVVMEDTVNAGDSVLIALGKSVVEGVEADDDFFVPWVDCDWCGGHAVGGIGMQFCPDCRGEGTTDNGMSCIACDGSGAVICPHCNKED